MKPISLWSKEARVLSTLEKVCLREAIEALLSWEPFKREYMELDLIRRLLEEDATIESALTFSEGAKTPLTAQYLRKRYSLRTPE
jgi:hypothetical protein